MIKLMGKWLTFKDIKALLRVYTIARSQKQGAYEYEHQGTYIKYKVDACHDIEVLMIE